MSSLPFLVCFLAVSASAWNFSNFAPPGAFYGFPAWISPIAQPNYTYGAYLQQPSGGYNNYNNATGRYNASGFYGSNLFVGFIWPNDRLLYNQTIEKPSRWWNSREKIIEYPGDVPKGHVRNETITALRIYDLRYDGKPGYASILDGGVGRTYAKIRLYSGGAGRGLHFWVQIFGH